MKKSRGKFLKATTSWLSDDEISETVDREYMRKVINDALKLPEQKSAYGADFYWGSGIFELMRHKKNFLNN